MRDCHDNVIEPNRLLEGTSSISSRQHLCALSELSPSVWSCCRRPIFIVFVVFVVTAIAGVVVPIDVVVATLVA